jgi:hypothetical protein
MVIFFRGFNEFGASNHWLMTLFSLLMARKLHDRKNCFLVEEDELEGAQARRSESFLISWW